MTKKDTQEQGQLNEEEYLAVAPEYKNAAYEATAPFPSDEKSRVEEEVREREEALAKPSVVLGVHAEKDEEGNVAEEPPTYEDFVADRQAAREGKPAPSARKRAAAASKDAPKSDS